MSSFKRITRHPVTGLLKIAWWIDDYFGNHHYGVKFEDDPKVYREEELKENHDKT